jgi:hypothetical protein
MDKIYECRLCVGTTVCSFPIQKGNIKMSEVN